MVFCNKVVKASLKQIGGVTILILIDGFLQSGFEFKYKKIWVEVTILILIDGFLQSEEEQMRMGYASGHNPYFNRWFSAIRSS